MAKIIHRADFRRLALPILFFPCLCAGLAYMYSVGLAPTYASKVVIGTEESSSWSARRFLTDIEMIKSGRVLGPAVQKLQERNSRIFQDETGKQLTAAKALAYFRNKLLHIQYYRGTPMIEITATADDPKEARIAANAVADSYAAFYAAHIQEFNQADLKASTERMAKLKTEIKSTDALIAKQKKKPKSPAAAREWTAGNEKLLIRKKNQADELERLQGKLDPGSSASAVRIVQKAEDTEPPIQTDTSGNVLFGILGGLIIGVSLALFNERSSNKQGSDPVSARST